MGERKVIVTARVTESTRDRLDRIRDRWEEVTGIEVPFGAALRRAILAGLDTLERHGPLPGAERIHRQGAGLAQPAGSGQGRSVAPRPAERPEEDPGRRPSEGASVVPAADRPRLQPDVAGPAVGQTGEANGTDARTGPPSGGAPPGLGAPSRQPASPARAGADPRPNGPTALTYWRTREGLSEADASKRFGVNEKRYRSWEDGSQAPNREERNKIHDKALIPAPAWGPFTRP